MGAKYKSNADKIWDLRNSIMHNGINNISFMSQTFMDLNQHLQLLSPTGYIYVNTNVLFQDFISSFEQTKKSIIKDTIKVNELGARLEWLTDNTDEYWSVTATSPGPIRFIVDKN